MLCNIDESLVEDARRILILLCLASRPLTIAELIDGIAVEIEDQGRFDVSRRLIDEHDIHRICPGLIDVGLDNDPNYDPYRKKGKYTPTISVAHFSVQEYLESGRINNSKAAKFGIKRQQAHDEVARICLTYLCSSQISQARITKDVVARYPLCHYAASDWHYHYKGTEDANNVSERLVLDFFQNQHTAFQNWVRLYDLENLWKIETNFKKDKIPSPIFCASFLGMNTILAQLLQYHQQIKTKQMNSQSEAHLAVARLIDSCESDIYGNALQAASYNKHESVIQLLLANGADINAQGGGYGNTLQAACAGGHESIVQLLLINGANINAQGGIFGNALQAACAGGHESIVQLLLINRANINAQGGIFGNALQAACVKGHESIVQLLLINRADINAQGGDYGNALQAACAGGHKSIVQLLLTNGADINAQGGDYGNTLQAACAGGHESIVQLLLTNGADINAQGGNYGNTLQAACAGGHESIVQLLLINGANINAQGGIYRNTLQAACAGGHESIVQLLLINGANINAQGGIFGNALQAACAGGHESIVQLLLINGADINV